MAKLVLTDCSVTINSVDLSDHIARVTINRMFDEIDSSNVGSAAAELEAGLERGDVSFEFQQDFASSSVNATIYALIGTKTTVVVKPTTGAVSATNPSYTASCLVREWPIIDAASGELSKSSVTWPVSGGWTQATA